MILGDIYEASKSGNKFVGEKESDSAQFFFFKCF